MDSTDNNKPVTDGMRSEQYTMTQDDFNMVDRCRNMGINDPVMISIVTGMNISDISKYLITKE